MDNGREVQRLLMQGFPDQKARQEARLTLVVDKAQQAHPHVRTEKRALETLVGGVEVKRKSYGGPELIGLCPTDGELNLPPRLYSYGVQEQLAEFCGKLFFAEAVSSLEKTTGVAVPKRQAEELAREASRDFLEFYRQREWSPAVETAGLLVMSMDGKGIVVRPADLREHTRKAAEKADGKKDKKRLGKGEKRNRKRMAAVAAAAAYSAQRRPRTAEEIMGLPEKGASPSFLVI